MVFYLYEGVASVKILRSTIKMEIGMNKILEIDLTHWDSKDSYLSISLRKGLL